MKHHPLFQRYPILSDLYRTTGIELEKHDTHHPVFHGATDWHSSVHAHWARLWLAQQLQDKSTIQALVHRLTETKIQQEFQGLVEQPDFERPYGRSWLLRLGVLIEEITGTTALRAALERCASELLSDLHETRDPNLGEYANPCWTALQLGHWYRHTGDTAAYERCVRWADDVRAVYIGRPELDTTRPEFFSLWALQSMVTAELLGPELLKEQVRGFDPGTIQPVSPLRSVHHLGINASRAWGLITVFNTIGGDQWHQAYERHLKASFALHAEWKDDAYAYAHWVPQFTIYALHLELGNSAGTSVS